MACTTPRVDDEQPGDRLGIVDRAVEAHLDDVLPAHDPRADLLARFEILLAGNEPSCDRTLSTAKLA